MNAQKRYPGRNRVMARTDAANLAYRQLAEPDGLPAIHVCTDPINISGIGLPGLLDRVKKPVPVEIQARCRKCPGCLAHRRRLWTARAIGETKASNRTWFGTLTLSPEQRFRQRLITDRRLSRGGWSDAEIASMPHPERFKAEVDTTNREITLWLKRVRKAAGLPLRYLLVSEAHASGDPHFHLLLHEPKGPVRKALLEEQWRLGFSHWRLVDTHDARSAYYACKYLSKTAQTRVRASGRYGQPQLVAALTERATKAARDAETLAVFGNPGPVSGGPLDLEKFNEFFSPRVETSGNNPSAFAGETNVNEVEVGATSAPRE